MVDCFLDFISLDWMMSEEQRIQRDKKLIGDNPELMEHEVLFKKMLLSGWDMWMLLECFRDMDTNGSGLIEFPEFLAYLKMTNKKLFPRRFTKRLFSIFDESGDGCLDLKEFVVSVWNYCLVGRGGLTTFCFDMYDTDNSGTLSRKQFDMILSDHFEGQDLEENELSRGIINRFINMRRGDTCPENELTLDLFGKMTATHGYLLQTAFNVQMRLRHKVCGVRFWRRIGKREVETQDGVLIGLPAFLASHTNKQQLLGLALTVVRHERIKNSDNVEEKEAEAKKKKKKKKKKKGGDDEDDGGEDLEDVPKFVEMHGMSGSVANRRKKRGVQMPKVLPKPDRKEFEKGKKKKEKNSNAQNDRDKESADIMNMDIVRNNEGRLKRIDKMAKKDREKQARRKDYGFEDDKKTASLAEKRMEQAQSFDFHKAKSSQKQTVLQRQREIPSLINGGP